MKSKRVVEWNDISESVKEMLWGIGWSNETKILWAEKAWNGVVINGLADYCNDLERNRVYLRLLSMIVLYGEFCSITINESFSPDFIEWKDIVELNPVRIGQMVGVLFELEETDDYTLIESAISSLVENSKNEVIKAISKEFGGLNLLFVGLWLTFENLEDDYNDESEDFEDDVYEEESIQQLYLMEYEELIKSNAVYVLNHNSTFTQAEAYSWLHALVQQSNL